jgi:hypothetical protein
MKSFPKKPKRLYIYTNDYVLQRFNEAPRRAPSHAVAEALA